MTRVWPIFKLSEVAEVTMGSSPPSSSYNQGEIGLPLVQGNADIKNRKAVPRVFTSEITKETGVESLLLTVRAPVGLVAKTNIKVCMGRGVSSIVPHKGLDRDYLYYFLLNYESSWTAVEQGSTFTAINRRDIEQIVISLPGLDEQQKIAHILSTVDKKIDLIEKKIQLTHRLKKGLMQKLFSEGVGTQDANGNWIPHQEFVDSPLGRIPKGWRLNNLHEYAGLMGGFAFKSGDAVEDGCRWLKIANVGKGEIVWRDISRLPEAYKDKFDEFVLNENDIVIALTRPVLSGTLKVAQIKKQDSGALLNQRVAKVVFRGNADKSFVYYLFESERMVSEISKAILGTDPPNISTGQIEKIKFAFPPVSEQRYIGKVLESVTLKIELLNQQKFQTQQLKKGLMQKLLTGEWRVAS